MGSNRPFNKVFLILIFAVSIVVLFTIQILVQTGLSWEIDFNKARLYAGTIGGLLSFVSVFLIYLTIENQRKTLDNQKTALKNQQDTFQLNQFENKFFEQVKFHRSNVENLEYKTARHAERSRRDETIKPVFEKGGRVITEIYHEIKIAINQVSDVLELYKHLNRNCAFEFAPYKEVYYQELLDVGHPCIIEEKLEKIAVIEVAYLAVFFGMARSGVGNWERLLKQKYNDRFVDLVKEKLSNKVAEWDKRSKFYHKSGKYRSLEERVSRNYHVKFFGGHQSRLGHYFRHIFQTVRYVNEQEFLSYNQKYQYIKTLRAQLTTYEQCILYINSISLLGRVWELDCANRKELDENQLLNHQLITKYNFIKNIPGEFFFEIQAKDFYPNIQYEGWEKTKKRKELEAVYEKMN